MWHLRWQKPTDQLGAEARELFPGCPGFGPLWFEVAGPGERASEAVLPCGEEWGLAGGGEQDGGGLAGGGEDVALELRGAFDTAKDGVDCVARWGEWFFDDVGGEHGVGFVGEDGWDVGGFVGEERAPAADACDVTNKWYVVAVADRDRGERDVLVAELLDEFARSFLLNSIAAVGDGDDVANGAIALEDVVHGFGKSVVDVDAAVARLEVAECGDGFITMAAGKWANDALCLGVKWDDGQFIFVTHEAGNAHRAFGGECDFGTPAFFCTHAAGYVDEDDDADGRGLEQRRNVHGDRQGLFNGGASPAACAKGVVPADHEQTAPKIVNIGGKGGDGSLREGCFGDIDKDDGFVGAEIAKTGGRMCGGDNFGFDMRSAERLGEGACFVGCAFDQEHTRLSTDEAVGFGNVVFEASVARYIESYDVAGESWERRREFDVALLRSLSDRDGLVQQRGSAGADDGEGSIRSDVAIYVDPQAEALAFAGSSGQFDTDNLRVGTVGIAVEGDNIDRHVVRSGDARSSEGVARGLAAIGEEDQALMAFSRQQRQAELYRVLDIGCATAGGGYELTKRTLRRGRAFDECAFAKDDDRGAILFGHTSECMLDECFSACALRKCDRVGAIDKENGCDCVDRANELRTSQRADHAQEDQRTQQQARPDTPARKASRCGEHKRPDRCEQHKQGERRWEDEAESHAIGPFHTQWVIASPIVWMGCWSARTLTHVFTAIVPPVPAYRIAQLGFRWRTPQRCWRTSVARTGLIAWHHRWVVYSHSLLISAWHAVWDHFPHFLSIDYSSSRSAQ